MGRPKGSKNKPKVPPTNTTTEVKVAPVPVVKKQPPVKDHAVLQFVDYAIERMDGIEMDCQRRLAKKHERPLRWWLAKSVMDFFRIQDPTFELSRLLKDEKQV